MCLCNGNVCNTCHCSRKVCACTSMASTQSQSSIRTFGCTVWWMFMRPCGSVYSKTWPFLFFSRWTVLMDLTITCDSSSTSCYQTVPVTAEHPPVTHTHTHTHIQQFSQSCPATTAPLSASISRGPVSSGAWVKIKKQEHNGVFSDGKGGETHACEYTHMHKRTRKNTHTLYPGKKMVWVQSLSHWGWSRRCLLSDHWLIITDNSKLYSSWSSETCRNPWLSRRLVKVRATALSSVGPTFPVVPSVQPQNFATKWTETTPTLRGKCCSGERW